LGNSDIFWHMLRFLVPIESPYATSQVNNTNLHSILHHFRVITAYWQNYCFDRGYIYLSPSFWVNLWNLDGKIWPRKLETSLCLVHKRFWYTKPFTRESPVWQIDGQMDRITIAIAKNLQYFSHECHHSITCILWHYDFGVWRSILRIKSKVQTLLWPTR